MPGQIDSNNPQRTPAEFYAMLEQFSEELSQLRAEVSAQRANMELMNDDISEEDSGGYLGEGGGGGSSDYAFKCIAKKEVDGNGNPYSPIQFTVKVFGGPAQVLGGIEKIYDDSTFENVANGSYVWVRYSLWDAAGNAVCEWDASINVTENKPDAEEAGRRALIFLIGRIKVGYERYVRQDRLGAIQAVAMLNASPSYGTINEIPAP